MSQTPSFPAANQQQMPAQMQGQSSQQTPQMMFMQQMGPAAFQQLSGQSQETFLMMHQQQARQNSGHQDGQRSREPRERLPSVYVGNLPKDYYQLDLYKHVKGLGYNVYQAVINVDKQTKRQNRYGFLQFFEGSEARRCAAEINNTKVGNNYIRCNMQEGDFMEPKANLVVKFIDVGVTQQQFYDTFAAFGAIRSCKLELFPDGKSRGFGYIQFESEETANLAIAQSGQLEFNGKKVEILNHQRKEQRPQEDSKFLNLFVQGLVEGTDDDKLQAMFAKFGEIQSAHVQRASEAEGLSNKGYVSFKTAEAAAAAVAEMHKSETTAGTFLLVQRHISKRENQVAGQSAGGATIQGSMRKTYESNLFVKNIPSEISEEEIVRRFEEIGPVISIKLRQGKYFNPQAAYRQYFILYKDIDFAKRAIQAFDQSTPFGARPLSVQFWMPTQELHQEREQRSFQEVQQYFLRNMLGAQYGPGGMQGMGGQRQYGDRPQGGYQGRGGRGGAPNDRQGGKFQNRGGYQNRRQGYGREGYRPEGQQQQSVPQADPATGQPISADQAQIMQQQMMAGQQQQPSQPQQMLVNQPDLQRIQGLDGVERRQEIGNNIYQVIQQSYGEAAGKITGMLLDNERIVDPIRLISDLAYLQTKAHEAWSLLQQQPDATMGSAPQQMGGAPQQMASPQQ